MGLLSTREVEHAPGAPAVKVPLVQWLQWIGATLVAAVTMSAFVFGNFETREAAREKKEGLERRLDRMENKMDVLIERVRR